MLSPYPYALRPRANSVPHHPLDLQPRTAQTSHGAPTFQTTPMASTSRAAAPAAVPSSPVKAPEPARKLKPSKTKVKVKRPTSANSALHSKSDTEHRSAIIWPSLHTGRKQTSRRPSSSGGLSQPLRSRAEWLSNRPGISDVLESSSAAEGEGFSVSPSDFGLQRRKSKSKRGESSKAQKESAESKGKFSTVDRAIFEELKRKTQAREAQFVIRNGKKHHGLKQECVPYPRNYDRQAVDHDVWNTMWTQQLCGSITWHVFETPPARVLDLGCGSGAWILDAARIWKETEFVGLDIVPLHPDLQQMGLYRLAARITWTHRNFLEALPFTDGEFDYVRMNRVARGVPENKWDDLLEEVSRVMKPGGALELFEEDLHFPGIVKSPQTGPDLLPLLSPVGSPSFERPRAPTPGASYLHQTQDANAGGLGVDASDTQDTHSEMSPVNPHDHSLLETLYNEMHAARFINLKPLTLLSNSLSLYFKNVYTHPPIMTMFPPTQVEPDPATDPFTERTPFSGAPRDSGASSPSSVAASASGRKRQESVFSDVQPEPHWVEIPQLIKGTEEYVKIDRSRFFANRTSARSSLSVSTAHSSAVFSDVSSAQSDTGHSSSSSSSYDADDMQLISSFKRLPNHTMHFDLQSLNMHLSLQVQEVLGCAEAMWDFVVDYQNGKIGSGSSRRDVYTAPFLTTRSTLNNALLDLTRRDFDKLLDRFEIDMHESMGLHSVLRDRLGWTPPPPSSPPLRQQEFDALCDSWTQWSAGAAPSRHGQSGGSDDTARSPMRSGEHSHEQAESQPASPTLSPRGERARRQAPHPDHVPPSVRLNRTMRVFVAWKAQVADRGGRP